MLDTLQEGSKVAIFVKNIPMHDSRLSQVFTVLLNSKHVKLHNNFKESIGISPNIKFLYLLDQCPQHMRILRYHTQKFSRICTGSVRYIDALFLS